MRVLTESAIIICERDYQSLLPLAENLRTPVAEALDAELGRAEIVADKDLPTDVVTMNSVVTFLDLDSKEETTVSLVYPREASVDLMKISILSPVGSALIGLRVGGEINWPLPNGNRRLLRVINVIQPEE
jgi:regulator of nucleoside diphosphate kinase